MTSNAKLLEDTATLLPGYIENVYDHFLVNELTLHKEIKLCKPIRVTHHVCMDGNGN